MKNVFFLSSFFFASFVQSQDTLMPMIFLDDVVISEEHNGFSVEDFVRYVKQDTTFYMGFGSSKILACFGPVVDP